jgi:organic hydroperoxide reductase OsmC/OhrA
MSTSHLFKLTVRWTGNKGTGTSKYDAYERSHSILVAGKPELPGSADPIFRGDGTKHNPEDLLIASLSSCHMLWYLHLCADAGVIVVDYTDNATGILQMSPKGGGHFSEVTLNPIVTLSEDSMIAQAIALHKQANEKCFIANSVNFKVRHNPVCKLAGN